MDPLFQQLSSASVTKAVILKDTQQHSSTELEQISKALADGSFDPSNYPKLVIAKPGTHYFASVKDAEGKEGTVLKVFTMNCQQSNEECPINIRNDVQALATHVRGEFRDGCPVSGFLSVKKKMGDNRDGAGTAFTTGITLHNGEIASPVVHSVQDQEGKNPVALWAERFHVLLGELAASAMPYAMSQEYVEFCRTRKAVYNAPCFGKDFSTQPFFVASQVNCSTGVCHLKGKAGEAHTDDKDCSASYSMSVNVSVIREGSKLGYFWLPALDIMVEMHPLQIIVFQGVEEHRGTPLVVAEGDSSALECNYPHDVRYNIIAYPNDGIINNSRIRNHESRHQRGHPKNLFHHAQPHFGGQKNYDTWRRLEMARLFVEDYKKRCSLPNVHFDIKKIFEGICLHDKEDFDSTVEEELSAEHFWGKAEAQLFHSRLKMIQSVVDTHLHKVLSAKKKKAKKAVMEEDAASSEPSMVSSSEHDETASVGANEETSSSVEADVAIQEEMDCHTSMSEDERHQEEQNTRSTSSEDDELQNLRRTCLKTVMDESNSSESEKDMDQQVQKDCTLVNTTGSFMDTYKEVLSVVALEKELEFLKTFTKTSGSISGGINNVVAGLPVMDNISTQEATVVPDLLFKYGDVMTHFVEKIKYAELMSNASRAAFAQFCLEAITLCSEDRASIWDIGDLEFEPNSIGLKLRDKINASFEAWEKTSHDTTQPLRVFDLKAKDLLGDLYNPSIHLDVLLTERKKNSWRMPRTGKAKAYVLVQAMWGLFLHQPTTNFLSTFGARGKPRMYSKNVYTDRLLSFDNHQRRTVMARFEVFTTVLDSVGFYEVSEEAASGIFMYGGFYELAFGTDLRGPAEVEAIKAQIQEHLETEEGEREQERIGALLGSIGAINADLYDYKKLLRNRGTADLWTGIVARGKSNMKGSGKKRKANTVVGPQAKKKRTSLPGDHQCLVSLDAALERISMADHGLCPFSTSLLDHLYQTAQVAKWMADTSLKLNASGRDKISSDDPLLDHINNISYAKYIADALSKDLEGDMRFGYRLTGPSLRRFQQLYPLGSMIEDKQKFVWHLLITRIWGFGGKKFFEPMSAAETVPAVVSALETIDGAYYKPGKAHSLQRAYGQLNILVGQRQNIAEKILQLSQDFANRVASGQQQTFESTVEFLAGYNISGLPATGLIIWLTACDLAEYGLCAGPKMNDFVAKLIAGQKGAGGGSGPTLALSLVEHHSGFKRPCKSEREYVQLLTAVFKVLEKLIGMDCHYYQGRGLNIADLEHLMCKITREEKGTRVKE